MKNNISKLILLQLNLYGLYLYCQRHIWNVRHWRRAWNQRPKSWRRTQWKTKVLSYVLEWTILAKMEFEFFWVLWGFLRHYSRFWNSFSQFGAFKSDVNPAAWSLWWCMRFGKMELVLQTRYLILWTKWQIYRGSDIVHESLILLKDCLNDPYDGVFL